MSESENKAENQSEECPTTSDPPQEDAKHDEVEEKVTEKASASSQWDDLGKGPVWVTDPSQSVRIIVGESPPSSLPPMTVDRLFRSAVDRAPQSMALAVKRNGKWKKWTWSEYYNDVQRVAKAFLKLGLEPFHGVGVLGFNSPEWFMSLLGGILAGGLGTGIYTTNSPDACRHILLNSKTNILVVENDKQLQKILPLRSELPDLKAIVQYTGELSEKMDDNVMTWNDLLEMGNSVAEEELQKRIDAQKPNNCCTLVYTSGTTGLPKGVMLSHDNITWTSIAGISTVRKKEQPEKSVSYLPLSHVAAQMMDIFAPMHISGEVWFAQPDALKGSLAGTLKEVRPTYLLGVPRVWEKISERFAVVSSSFGMFKSKLVNWARQKALQGNLNKERGESTPFGYWLANDVLLKRVREEFGLDRCSYCFTGAAPISKETTEFFLSVGLPLLDIYGMSESSGPGTISGESVKKLGSCGLPFNGCEMKLDNADDEGNGEVCFRGRHVFMGYLDMEDKTKEALDEEGWLHTGDIGKKDDDGYYYLTGRIKEIIVTSGGENIPPVLIENEIKAQLPIISNVMVVGDKRKFLSCVLTLKVVVNFETGEPTDNLSEIAIKECVAVGSQAKRVSEIIEGADPKVLEMIEKGIKKANEKAISNAQKVQKWRLIPVDFSIPGGELGPTLKLKRKSVAEKYQETIDRMYEV